MDKLFLHIATDEKFIDAAMHLFNNSFPGQSELRVIKSDNNRNLVHVKYSENIKIILLEEDWINEVLNEIQQYKFVVFHNIDRNKANLISKLSKNRKFKVIWIFWGGEIYNNVYFNSDTFLSESTKQLLNFKQNSIVSKFIKSIKLKLTSFYHPHFKIKTVVKNVDIFLGLKSDFDFVKSLNIFSKGIEFVNFSYYPIEFIVKGIDENSLSNVSDNKKILIGNSATPQNNHIDVFNVLKDRKEIELIVPLNYGDEDYKKIITASGMDIFKERFIPLLNFLSLKEYNQLLAGTSVAIMNHYRQQGVGNIITLLWLGKKLFLNENSTLFRDLVEKEFIIYGFSDLKNDSLDYLSENDKNKNRKLVELYFGEQTLIKDLWKIQYV